MKPTPANPIRDCPPIKPLARDSCPADGSADFWCVRFQTNEGHSHPIWYGEKGGKQWPKEQIERLAESYLKENSHWLKSIDDIYPPNNKVSHTAGRTTENL